MSNNLAKVNYENTSESKSSLKNKYNEKSQDISISELELIANKNKFQKKSVEVSVSKIKTKSKSKSKSKSVSKKKSKSKSSISASSDSSDNTKSTIVREKKKRQVIKENKDYKIYQEKITLLNKLYALYEQNASVYKLELSPDYLLSEIKQEYNNKLTEVNYEKTVKMIRFGLMITIISLEFFIGKFEPAINGWAETVSYNIEKGEFDSDLLEIAEKYFGGTGGLPVEVRILGAILLSGAKFIIMKKFFNKDLPQKSNVVSLLAGQYLGKESGDMLQNIFGNVFSEPQQNQQQSPQQNFQQSPQQSPQQNFQQRQQQSPQVPQRQFQQNQSPQVPQRQFNSPQDFLHKQQQMAQQQKIAVEQEQFRSQFPQQTRNQTQTEFDDRDLQSVFQKMQNTPEKDLDLDDLLKDEPKKTKRIYKKQAKK